MKNILILCGGKSAEHEVSLMSARNIISALDRMSFQPIPVIISRSGSWYWVSEPAMFTNVSEFEDNNGLGQLCTLMRHPDQTLLITNSGQQIRIDAAFPLVHGPMGEDGTLQGLLELMSIPYVGSGVMASAIGMDKDMMKKVLAQEGIPVGPLVTLTDPDNIPDYADIARRLDSKILFVKPAVMGSSVGISKVTSKDKFKSAVEQAFRYGFKVLIEKFVPGREVECSVLGNREPVASCVGEIKPNHDFYSYEAKYLDPNGAELIIPANLPQNVAEKVRELAVLAFQAIECRGFARVDFFIEGETVYVNELNTIPGFTSISMYPKMWEASGISYTDLISRLIALAFEDFEAKQSIHFRPEAAFEKKTEKVAS